MRMHPELPPPPETQIEIIKSSFRCLALGSISLIPGIGLPFGVIAIAAALRAQSHSRNGWNPAKMHLEWGARFACVGLIITTLLGIIYYTTDNRFLLRNEQAALQAKSDRE
jgi:hypothetical protein